MAAGTERIERAPDPRDATGIAVLDADPKLLRHVAPDEAGRARRAVIAPLVVVPEGTFDPAECLAAGAGAFAAIVISGLIARELSVGGQPTLHLLGPGDLVHAREVEAGLLGAEQSWTASLPTRLALLDDRFLHAVRRWPRLLTALVERTHDIHHQALVQLAISQQPRVEDRLLALFGALAGRWGRTTAEGIVVPLTLTHEALGRLIGARRPTVTLALKALADAGRLQRRGDGGWTLPGAPSPDAKRDFEPLATSARPRLVV